jgi:hypothetical protein
MTFFFADLVMGPNYSELEKKTQLFKNHVLVSFLVEKSDFNEVM